MKVDTANLLVVEGRYIIVPLITADRVIDLRYEPWDDRLEYDGWKVSRRYLLDCYRELRRPDTGYEPKPMSTRINLGPRLTLYPEQCRELLDVVGRLRRYIPSARRPRK